MTKGIIILGPSGAGKTTLGKIVAQELGFSYIDIDEYIWRQDTVIPFTAMYSRAEKINRLMGTVSQTDNFVMAGSMDSFHEHFDPFFDLAIHLTADASVRVMRVHEREYALLGSRILEGGDMYTNHQRYLDDIACYDSIGGLTSNEVHRRWAESLPCPVLHLDGGDDLIKNSRIIIDEYKNITSSKLA